MQKLGLQNRFVITSNRESGFGRYDVVLTPLDMEIHGKHYEADLITKGYAPKKIRKYGFAFKGKECLIKEG